VHGLGDDLPAVLQVVHRAITPCLLDQAGLKADEADSGVVTLIQPGNDRISGCSRTLPRGLLEKKVRLNFRSAPSHQDRRHPRPCA